MSEMFAENIQALKSSQEGALGCCRDFIFKAGYFKDRLALAVALGNAGDPRLASPNDSAYWREVDLGYEKVSVARFPSQ